jgi:orotate phosphoribosyltransferase
MSFSQDVFDSFIIEQGIVGFFPQPIKLVSGRFSSWYVNWRNVSSDVYQMDKLSDFVLDFLRDHKLKPHCIYGTPDGATKLAVLCQDKWAKQQKDYGPGKYPLAMGRKTPKDHGEAKDRFFVGAPSGKVVVLEDVTTTGGSLLKTISNLIDLEIEVSAAIALTNRNEVMDDGRHISKVLQEMKVPYFAMSEGVQLLPLAFSKALPSNKIRQSILKEFKQYGEKEIHL